MAPAVFNSFLSRHRKTLLSQICIVFTDGQATDSNQVPAASKAWRQQGIKVFAVGIGNGIDLEGKESTE